MERRIGTPLFERTTRRVELTPIGRRLSDAPPYQWRFVWLSATATATIRASDRAAATWPKARRT